jgi:hypothetical protein
MNATEAGKLQNALVRPIGRLGQVDRAQPDDPRHVATKWPSSKPKRSRPAKWAMGIGIALIVYALVGFFLLPAHLLPAPGAVLRRVPPIHSR